jgi:CRP-like cAMP-binding protein
MNTLLEAPSTKTKTLEREWMHTRIALHPFLVGMNPKQLALLTDCAISVRFKKGQTILREGELANRFYLIESGKVVLESGEGFGEPVIVETIGAGDLLGWSWMFPTYVWHFTARAGGSRVAVSRSRTRFGGRLLISDAQIGLTLLLVNGMLMATHGRDGGRAD